MSDAGDQFGEYVGGGGDAVGGLQGDLDVGEGEGHRDASRRCEAVGGCRRAGRAGGASWRPGGWTEGVLRVLRQRVAVLQQGPGGADREYHRRKRDVRGEGKAYPEEYRGRVEAGGCDHGGGQGGRR